MWSREGEAPTLPRVNLDRCSSSSVAHRYMQRTRPAFHVFACLWAAAFLLSVLAAFSDHAGLTSFHHHGAEVADAHGSSHHDHAQHDHSHGHHHHHPVEPADENGDNKPVQIPGNVVHVDCHQVKTCIEILASPASGLPRDYAYQPITGSVMKDGPAYSIEYPPRLV